MGGATILSSRSELLRFIEGAEGSARSPRPIDEEECGIRLPLMGSIPAETSLAFALSLSERNLSLSCTRCVH